MVLAAGAMAAVLWVAEGRCSRRSTAGIGLRWVALGVLVSLGLATYAAAGQLTGAFDISGGAPDAAPRQAGLSRDPGLRRRPKQSLQSGGPGAMV